ncbi:hypothetical protein [Streptomyces anulatus]
MPPSNLAASTTSGRKSETALRARATPSVTRAMFRTSTGDTLFSGFA